MRANATESQFESAKNIQKPESIIQPSTNHCEIVKNEIKPLQHDHLQTNRTPENHSE